MKFADKIKVSLGENNSFSLLLSWHKKSDFFAAIIVIWRKKFFFCEFRKFPLLGNFVYRNHKVSLITFLSNEDVL